MDLTSAACAAGMICQQFDIFNALTRLTGELTKLHAVVVTAVSVGWAPFRR